MEGKCILFKKKKRKKTFNNPINPSTLSPCTWPNTVKRDPVEASRRNLVAICLSAPLQALAFISQTANLWIYIYIHLQCLLIIFSIGNLKVNETRIKVLARVRRRTQEKKRDGEREREKKKGGHAPSRRPMFAYIGGEVIWKKSGQEEGRLQLFPR